MKFKKHEQSYTSIKRGDLLYSVTLDRSNIWIIFVYREGNYLTTFTLPESQATDPEDAVNKVRLMEDLR